MEKGVEGEERDSVYGLSADTENSAKNNHSQSLSSTSQLHNQCFKYNVSSYSFQ